MPTNTDYALAAGLLLGEGCIGIYERTTRTSFNARVAISMKDHGTIEWLYSTFGGAISRRTDKNGLWDWKIEHRSKIHNFILHTIEYMIFSTEKYSQALIMLAFCTAPRLRGCSVQEKAKRLQFCKDLHRDIADLKPRSISSGVQSRFVTNLLIEPN